LRAYSGEPGVDTARREGGQGRRPVGLFRGNTKLELLAGRRDAADPRGCSGQGVRRRTQGMPQSAAPAVTANVRHQALDRAPPLRNPFRLRWPLGKFLAEAGFMGKQTTPEAFLSLVVRELDAYRFASTGVVSLSIGSVRFRRLSIGSDRVLRRPPSPSAPPPSFGSVLSFRSRSSVNVETFGASPVCSPTTGRRGSLAGPPAVARGFAARIRRARGRLARGPVAACQGGSRGVGWPPAVERGGRPQRRSPGPAGRRDPHHVRVARGVRSTRGRAKRDLACRPGRGTSG